MMDLAQLKTKRILFTFTIMVIIAAAVFHINTVINYLLAFIELFNPFFVGLAIAYFFNVFMVIVEKRIKNRFGKYRRLVSFGVTLTLLVLIVTFVLFNVVPNMVQSIRELVESLKGLDATINSLVGSNQGWLAGFDIQIPELDFDFDTILATLQNNYQLLLGGLSSYATRAIGGLSTFFIGLFFSIYLILYKEKLVYQTRRVLYALVEEKRVDGILEVASLANRTFKNFITGQCLEALILGLMFALSMTLLKLPYAMLVGSLVSVMALIPIVGAFISFLIGFFLILIVDFNQALLFAGLYLVLQQIEGNLIYPNVVGSSVGLPSIWTFASVVVGGSLFGVVGMFVMIPLVSVGYTLFKKHIDKRHSSLGIDARKFYGGQAVAAAVDDGDDDGI